MVPAVRKKKNQFGNEVIEPYAVRQTDATANDVRDMLQGIHGPFSSQSSKAPSPEPTIEDCPSEELSKLAISQEVPEDVKAPHVATHSSPPIPIPISRVLPCDSCRGAFSFPDHLLLRTSQRDPGSARSAPQQSSFFNAPPAPQTSGIHPGLSAK